MTGVGVRESEEIGRSLSLEVLPQGSSLSRTSFTS